MQSRLACPIGEREVLAGGFEPRARRLVQEWALLRKDQITAKRERARRNEPMLGIEPLA